MSHRKDYRKTPAQNHRAAHGTTGVYRKPIKEWIIIGIAGVLLLIGAVWVFTQVDLVHPVTTKQEKERVVAKNKRAEKKKRKLTESYEEVMILGDVDTETKNHKEAANRFFDAKTIYPQKLEPRIALTETYLKRCKDGKQYYCLRTARELNYAQLYVYDHTPPKLVEQLDAMQSELNKIYTVKDSVMLYVH